MAVPPSPPPADYEELLGDLRRQVRTSQTAAMRAANAKMLELYRTIGRTLLERLRHGWTAQSVQRMEADLRARFPDMVGLSPGNLDYMRRFAEAWPDPAVGPELAALPWGHVRILLDEASDPEVRDQYAVAAVQYGWSHDVLLHQILSTTTAPGAAGRREAQDG